MMMSRGVGGGHFRKKIDAGIETTLSDVTHEGLFGDYYFTVGEEKEKDFKPSYSFGVVRDPISNEKQHYLCVGLNSKFDGEGIHKYGRPRVQLVICLDTSGSMNIGFDKGDSRKSKLDTAKEALLILFEHLRGDDLFALITFDEESHTIQDLKQWDSIDKNKLKAAIKDLVPSGGTSLSVGYVSAASMLTEEAKKRETVKAKAGEVGGVAKKGEEDAARPTERRIMFLTDMCPNAGEKSAEGLFGIADRFAKIGIFSTFIGVGLDFNTELVNHITKNILAASYFSVLSEADFRKQMAEDFDYLVCPLVFNVTLALKAKTKHIAIDRIFGSPESDETSGELMKVGTLFPSARVNGETKGGVVLIKLNVDKQIEGGGVPGGPRVGEKGGEQKIKDEEEVEGVADRTKLELRVKFASRDSEGEETQTETVDLIAHEPPFFQNMGVRKSLLLTQFVNLVTALIGGEPITAQTGIPLGLSNQQKKTKPTKSPSSASTSASTSSSASSSSTASTYRVNGSLRLTPTTVAHVKTFLDYFQSESKIIGDPKLTKEADVLRKLLEQNQKAIDADNKPSTTTTDVDLTDDF